MSVATVKIEGLSPIQANAIGMMCESGMMADCVNEYLKSINTGAECFEESQQASVEFDSSSVPDHVVTFNS